MNGVQLTLRATMDAAIALVTGVPSSAASMTQESNTAGMFS